MPLVARRDRRDGPGRTRRTGHTRRDRESPGTLCGVCGAPGARAAVEPGPARVERGSARGAVRSAESQVARRLRRAAARSTRRRARGEPDGRESDGCARRLLSWWLQEGCCSGRVRATSRRMTNRATSPPSVAEIRTPEAIQPAVSVQSAADVRRGSATALASQQPRRSRQRALPAVVRPVGFVALPGAAGLPDFESGEIVRMEIPLTSLPTYGIEILPDAQGSPVEADLLVGQDGQARAIRLVTTSASR